MSTTTTRRRIDRDAAVRRYEAGESLRRIAASTGFSHAAVYRVLKEAGVVFRPAGGNPVPGGRKEEILAAYRAGMRIEEILATFRTSEETIRALVEEAGEPRRPRGARRRLDWEQIGRLHDRDWPVAAIAILVGCSGQQVRRVLREVRPCEEVEDELVAAE
uniref:helix-turn-helix domain-containing protein n=1 Tax=Streptosporangium sp. CA-235898 TaxID=3240073 RepID=UPI003F4979ED